MTTTSSRCSAKIALAFLLFLCSCKPVASSFGIGGYSYDTDRFEQWKLPGSLREISGLAETPDGRLFAHADERAVIHQIDYQSGKRLKSFSLGNRSNAKNGKALKGDFEGIAVVDDQVYLVTSEGTIVTARLGMDDSTVAFETHRTGLGESCEVEGLAYHANLNVLLLACKVVYSAELHGQLVVFQWSIEGRSVLPEATLTVPLGTDFNPSGIAVSPRNGNLLLVAARQRALLEVTMAGVVVNIFTLPMERYHRQTEGIALFADGTLVLADEGGNKRGRLGVYRATD